MTSLSLVTVAVCLFVIPALGGWSPYYYKNGPHGSGYPARQGAGGHGGGVGAGTGYPDHQGAGGDGGGVGAGAGYPSRQGAGGHGGGVGAGTGYPDFKSAGGHGGGVGAGTGYPARQGAGGHGGGVGAGTGYPFRQGAGGHGGGVGAGTGYPARQGAGGHGGGVGAGTGYPSRQGAGGHGGGVGAGTGNPLLQGAGGHGGGVGAGSGTNQAGAGQGRPFRRLPRKLPQLEVYVNPQDAVATSVVRTTDQYFYKPAPVGFDHIITNINGGYNKEYGVFTAPVPGIYSVNYHVQSKKGSTKEAYVDLTQNGQVVNSAKAEGNCVTASNSAVLYLDQFDRLSVNGREGTIIGCKNNGFCSFSVSLVKPGRFTDLKIPRAVPMDKSTHG
ncbi:complement C1q-like protein 4 [Liolophura sinensis]|uniref:complement C1q-like protein 4 n=1 Tax=Liolophura sinensis TaxID=3198878 RepID=UPI0031580FAE